VKQRLIYLSVCVLGILGAVISALTIDLHVRIAIDPSLAPSYCHVSDTVDCLPVIGSAWSEFFGIPLGSYGISFYVVIVVLGILGLLRVGGSKLGRATGSSIFVLSLAAVIGSIALFCISHFIIKALCPLCLALYLVNFLLFSLSYFLSNSSGIFGKIKSGISAIFAFPMSAGGVGNFSKQDRWIARAFLIPLALLLYFSYRAVEIHTKRILTSPEVQAKMANQVTQAIAEWEKASEVEFSVQSTGALADYPLGDHNAPVKIFEYSDFECPFCRQFYHDLEEILAEYKDKIYFVPLNFPIDNSCNPSIPMEAHHNACDAAFFVRCAAEQGRFWDAYRYIFELPAFEEGLDPIATKLKINEGTAVLKLDEVGMKECLASDRPRAKILEDIENAEDLGLEGTPTIWINGKKVSEVHQAVIRKIIDKILASK